MNRPIVKVKSATMFPSPTLEPHVIEGANVAGVQFQAGVMMLTERVGDGSMVLWVNVPCKIEHSEPSGLVAGGGIVGA